MKREEAQQLVELKEDIRTAQAMLSNGREEEGKAVLAGARTRVERILRKDMKEQHPQLTTL